MGLASWLYWEDYLGGSGGGGMGAASQKAAAYAGEKSPEEADMDAIREANDHEESTDPGEVTVKRRPGDGNGNGSEEDEEDEEDDRKPSSRNRDSGNEQEETAADPANAAHNNDNPPAAAAAAAAAAGFDGELSPDRNVNQGAAAALNAPPPPLALPTSLKTRTWPEFPPFTHPIILMATDGKNSAIF